jgi:hypothetical protein
MSADQIGTDDGDAGQFESWRSYWNFRHEVPRGWRYVRSPQSHRFLAAVAIGSHSRSIDIPKGRNFYRAQVADRDEPVADIEDTVLGAALPERMRPIS